MATLSFNEVMKGYISMGETEILTGYSKALLAGTLIETILTVTAENLEKFINEPEHAAVPAGTIKWPAMGGDLPIQGGEFQLFVDTGNPLAKRLNYQLFVTGPQGPLTVSGYKTLTDNPTAGIWFDTSTLWTKIFPGHISIKETPSKTPVGAGIINLYKWDFLTVVFSFRVKGKGSFFGRLRFLKFFFGTIIRFWFAKIFGPRD